jgi:protein arginine kinase activator
MLCQVCENKPATIHITEIHGGKKNELHLCEECAQEKGVTHGGNVAPALLASLLGERARTADLKCPECGITFEEFRMKGRFGCPRDYEVFAKELAPLLEKIHGAQKHTGRVPRGAATATPSRGDTLRRLRRDLAKAVKEENYEEAARLRDEIQAAEEALRGPA